MSRKEARETVFKLVYEMCVTGAPNELSLELYIEELDAADREYAAELFRGIEERQAFLNIAVERYSKAFRIDRVYKIDLAVLFVACYEILFCNDVPFQVAANEAVELSKKYSTEKSYRFVNGVLSSVIRDKAALLDEYSGFAEKQKEN